MFAVKLTDNNKVEIIYNNLTGVDLTDCILIDKDLPMPENRLGKNPILYCNPLTKEVWYEYVDRPLTKEEQLELQIKTLQETILELLGV